MLNLLLACIVLNGLDSSCDFRCLETGARGGICYAFTFFRRPVAATSGSVEVHRKKESTMADSTTGPGRFIGPVIAAVIFLGGGVALFFYTASPWRW